MAKPIQYCKAISLQLKLKKKKKLWQRPKKKKKKRKNKEGFFIDTKTAIIKNQQHYSKQPQ